MSLYRISIQRHDIEIEVDGDSMSQVANLPRIREMGRVHRVELVTEKVKDREPAADVVGTCEACDKLIFDFQEYTMDDDCVMICEQCLDEEQQERDMERKMLHGC